MYMQSQPVANLTNALRDGASVKCGRETLDRIRTMERMRVLFSTRNISVQSPVSGDWYEIETDTD